MQAGTSEAVIDDGDVEPELAEVLGLELLDLQLDNDLPQLFDVEEQQVNVEVIAYDVEVDLAPDVGEAAPELEQCLLGRPIRAASTFFSRARSVRSRKSKTYRSLVSS